MNAMLRKGVVCAAAVAMLSAVPAVAGPWAQPGGAGQGFGYSQSFSFANGQDVNGLFGEPFLDSANDTFYFFESAFQVTSQNGGSSSQFDEVSLDVYANPGLTFSLMRVTANGSFNAGGGGASNEVDLSAILSLTELGANDMYDGGGGDDGRDFSGDMVAITDDGGTFPKSNDAGTWNGLATVDVTVVFPVPDDAIHVSMSNDVIAITTAGGTAEIDVQYQDLKIEFQLIPEPASLSLLAVGALALVRRRR
jgi:hypothetical protein